MNIPWRREWATNKCRMLEELFASGSDEFGYAEATILLTSVLSAFSAEVWPGNQGINGSRFVELLVRYGKYQTLCRSVSVPLLIHHLESLQQAELASRLGRHFHVPRSALVIQGKDLGGPECDALFEVVAEAVPEVSRDVLRRHSYAALLYGEVRSAYAHQYCPGKRAASRPMAGRSRPAVSYVNRMDDDSPYLMRRLIHFHTEWLSDLVLELSAVLDQLPELPLPRPEFWWLDRG